MDLFTSYCLRGQRFVNRMFVSAPPSDALLLWSKDFGQSICGVSLVKQDDHNNQNELTGIVLKYLNSINIDIDIIEYSLDLKNFKINSVEHSSSSAAEFISNKYNIELGQEAAKEVNNRNRVRDPFHVWSREIFHGDFVQKIDVDAIVLDPSNSKIETVLEVKNSPRVAVGKWLPYISGSNNDRVNYLMQINFAKIIGCNFVTVHISKKDHEELNEDDTFDCFLLTYEEMRNNTLDASLAIFAAEKNRKIYKVSKLLSYQNSKELSR